MTRTSGAGKAGNGVPSWQIIRKNIFAHYLGVLPNLNNVVHIRKIGTTYLSSIAKNGPGSGIVRILEGRTVKIYAGRNKMQAFTLFGGENDKSWLATPYGKELLPFKQPVPIGIAQLAEKDTRHLFHVNDRKKTDDLDYPPFFFMIMNQGGGEHRIYALPKGSVRVMLGLQFFPAMVSGIHVQQVVHLNKLKLASIAARQGDIDGMRVSIDGRIFGDDELPPARKEYYQTSFQKLLDTYRSKCAPSSRPKPKLTIVRPHIVDHPEIDVPLPVALANVALESLKAYFRSIIKA